MTINKTHDLVKNVTLTFSYNEITSTLSCEYKAIKFDFSILFNSGASVANHLIFQQTLSQTLKYKVFYVENKDRTFDYEITQEGDVKTVSFYFGKTNFSVSKKDELPEMQKAISKQQWDEDFNSVFQSFFNWQSNKFAINLETPVSVVSM